MVDEFNMLGENLDSEVFSEEQKESSLNKIKPYIGTILKILIVILIVFGLYYYFYMRYVNVSFEIINLEKGQNYKESSTITLDLDGKISEIDTDEITKILPGDYIISVNDPNLSNLYLKDELLSITKEDDDSTFTIILYPEWSKNLSEFKLINKSDTIYTNQKVTLTASIKNSGKNQKIKIIGTNDLNDIQEYIDLKPGDNNFELSFVNKRKNKEKVSGTLKIESADFISLNYSATTKTSPNLKIIGNANYTAYAGQTLNMKFELDNGLNVDNITDLELSIDNATLDSDIIKSWISNAPEKIDVNAKQKKSIDLNFNIPLQNKDKVSFNLNFKNSFATATKLITITINDPQIELPKEIDFDTLTAGNTSTKTILIDNKTNYELNLIADTTYDIPTTSNTNTLEQIYSIISIELPEKLIIGKNEIPFSFIIPPTFLSDNIKGKVKIKSELKDFEIPFSIIIQGIEISFTTTLSPQYTFDYDSTNFSIEKQESIKINNTGNVDLNVYAVNITGDSDCTSRLQIKPIISPSTLTKSNPLEVILTMKKSAKPLNPITKVCSFDITYLDPKTNTQTTKTNQFTLNA